MSVVMHGPDVAKAMKEFLIIEVANLREQGIVPCLTIIRVGKRPDDLAYEQGAMRRMSITNIECRVVELPEDISQEDFENEFRKINDDPSVHGILLFRPLPRHLDEEPIKAMINPSKDVDCMSPVNIAKVFFADKTGFAPCTPEAVIEVLDYYGIDPTGKKVTIIGRSLIVGKPLSMLLLQKNATITICHTRTRDLAATCREAEILVAAAGAPEMVKADMVKEGAVVLDVGINVHPDGTLCGDVDFNEVEPKVSYITPVPRGVGSVTSCVLAKHVVRAAKKLNGMEA